MLYVDIPTLPEIRALIAARADACVSIYLPTTPHTQDVKGSRIAFGNLTRSGTAGSWTPLVFDKRRRALLEAELAALGEDDAFWRLQAHSLAVLATPDSVRTFRLATAVTETVEVSDRFHIKPLLRAIAFPQTAFVLALSRTRCASSRCSPTCRRPPSGCQTCPRAPPTPSAALRSTI